MKKIYGIILVGLLVGVGWGTVPDKIAIQGYLTEGGKPVTATNAKFTVEMLDIEFDTTAPVAQISLPPEYPADVKDGYFTILVPFNAKAKKVKISYNGRLIGEQALYSVPFARYAGTIDGVTIKEGKVGINTLSPEGRLSLNGNIRIEREDGSSYRDTQANMSISSNNGPRGLRFTMSLDNGQNWKDVLLLGENGNVGIGTTNPTTQLEVSDAPSSDKAVLTVKNNAVVDGSNWYPGIYGESPGIGVKGKGYCGVYGASSSMYGVYGKGPIAGMFEGKVQATGGAIMGSSSNNYAIKTMVKEAVLDTAAPYGASIDVGKNLTPIFFSYMVQYGTINSWHIPTDINWATYYDQVEGKVYVSDLSSVHSGKKVRLFFIYSE